MEDKQTRFGLSSKIRFEIVPSNLVEAINNITDTKVLKSLQIHAIKCNTIDEFREKMKSAKNG
jgi:hypothetical protein